MIVSATPHHAHHYRVTHQEQSEDIDPSTGERRKVWTVHLEHEGGVKATVELPESHYTAENVHELASQQANEVGRVSGLPQSLGEPGAGQAGR